MRTTSEAAVAVGPASSARALADMADRWDDSDWADVAPRESAVVGFFDPAPDLERRAAQWGFSFETFHLTELLRFMAGLAKTEAEAWAADDPVIATQAIEQRRYLFTDRVVHWAVPWLDAVGRCHPNKRAAAHADRDLLLRIGDEDRSAPALTGDEGLFLPGEDAFGPMKIADDLAAWLASVWSGLVILDATLLSITGGDADRTDLADIVATEARRGQLRHIYEAAAGRWRSLARAHPGTARLWLHLASRADRTAAAL